MIDILIVDNERHIRELLARWLGAEGYAIHEADGAEAALAVLASQPIAVMTIDKDMPGQDGTWLVEQVQQRHPGVAMLLATGDDGLPLRISLSRGVQGYMVKPFKREIVVQAVSDAVVWHKVASRPKKRPADQSES